MKKVMIFICIFLSIIMFPSVKAKETVLIESVSIEEKSTTSIEKQEPVIDGLKIKFDIKFNNLNDYIKYKIVINNSTNEDYEIDTKTSFEDSDYIKYNYEFNDNNKTVKKNSKTTIYMKVSYDKIVPNDLLEDDVFEENNTFNISLSNEENPSTGDNRYGLIIGCVFLMILSIYMLFYHKTKVGISLVILLCILLIPSTLAIKKLQIIVETKITIQKEKNVMEARYNSTNYRKLQADSFNRIVDNPVSIEERDFWIYASKIESITFKTNNEQIDTYDYKYDISESKNNSIIAYLVKNSNSCKKSSDTIQTSLSQLDSDENCFDLTIVSNGTIYANKDSSFVFADMFNLSKINGLENYNTEYATSMKAMFYNMTDSSNNALMSNNKDYKVVKINKDRILAYGVDDKALDLDLSHFNTSNVTDMSYMFANNFERFNSVDLSSFNTSKVTTMASMFYRFNPLKKYDVSHFVTNNVTDMSSMFYQSNIIESFENFNTSKVENMSYMFAMNDEIISLDLSHFDTSKVTNMSGMFYECIKLKSLNISNFDTSNVTDMSYMFCSCHSLLELDVSHLNTTKVENMSYMFGYCEKITMLDVSLFNTSKVTDMSGMFSGCKSITSLNLKRFDTSNVTNMNSMFSNCSSIITLDISSFNTSKVTDMSYMFQKMSECASIFVGDDWSVSNVNQSLSMFLMAEKLRNYNSAYTDKTRAHTGEDGYLNVSVTN